MTAASIRTSSHSWVWSFFVSGAGWTDAVTFGGSSSGQQQVLATSWSSELGRHTRSGWTGTGVIGSTTCGTATGSSSGL